MKDSKSRTQRRKFMLGALFLGLTGSLGIFQGMRLLKRLNAGQKVRMITRDGKLVEVDSRLIKESQSTPLTDVAFEEFKTTDSKHLSNIQEDD